MKRKEEKKEKRMTGTKNEWQIMDEGGNKGRKWEENREWMLETQHEWKERKGMKGARETEEYEVEK